MKALHVTKLALFALLSTLPVQAAQCPDYGITDHMPSLLNPNQHKFKKWGNRWLSSWYTPYHMVHDQIVAAGSSATMVGKFDYDWAMHKDLEGEYVHAYIYGTHMSSWHYLGRYKTDSDGKVYVPVSAKPEGDYVVRMVVEGDLSSATGYLTVASQNRPTVLFDIDGTITVDDFEAVNDYLNTDNAENYPYATNVVNTYINRGYQVIFLTGRPYWITKNTRQWSEYSGIKPWHLHTNSNSDNPLNMQTQAYKTEYIKYLKNKVGLNIIRAYGNAQTDIDAYADAGIDASQTYIIGDNAGNNNTQPLHNSYESHYYDIVLNQPYVQCTAH